MRDVLEIREKFKHLFQLLDDESAEIQRILRQEFLKHSVELIFGFRQYLKHAGPEQREHAIRLLNRMKDHLVLEAFRTFVRQEAIGRELDLEQTSIALSFWNDPLVNAHQIIRVIDAIAEDIRATMPKRGHPLTFIDHINKILFQKYRFRGNAKDFYNPENSFLNKVLETRRGIPISLSILYLLIAERLHLPIKGVGLPGHFILKYADEEDEIFFAPFMGGKIYSRKECLSYLQRTPVEDPEKILRGCNHREVTKRVLRNLRLIYSSYQPDEQKAAYMEQLLDIIELHEA